MIRSAMIALPLFAMSLPVAAQDDGRPTIVRGLCSKGGCSEFTILSKDFVKNGLDGKLYATRVQTFHADSTGRQDRGLEDGFVYCSIRRPAILSAPPGKPAVAFMISVDDDRPSWALRPTVNFVTLYFALCHGAEAGRMAAVDRRLVAGSFGYRVALARSETVKLVKVDDILDPATAKSALPTVSSSSVPISVLPAGPGGPSNSPVEAPRRPGVNSSKPADIVVPLPPSVTVPSP